MPDCTFDVKSINNALPYNDGVFPEGAMTAHHELKIDNKNMPHINSLARTKITSNSSATSGIRRVEPVNWSPPLRHIMQLPDEEARLML